MKYLKRFNEDHNFTSVSAQELEDDVNQDLEIPKMDISEFEKILADFEERLVDRPKTGDQVHQYLSSPSIESVTNELGQLKKDHPYITYEEPYKKIWWDFLKNKWHKKVKETDKYLAQNGIFVRQPQSDKELLDIDKK